MYLNVIEMAGPRVIWFRGLLSMLAFVYLGGFCSVPCTRCHDFSFPFLELRVLYADVATDFKSFGLFEDSVLMPGVILAKESCKDYA